MPNSQGPTGSDEATVASLPPTAETATSHPADVAEDSLNTDHANGSQQPHQLPQPDYQAQRELKRLEAENRILSDANDSLEQKLAAFQERQAEQEHAHTALTAQHQHVLRLIRAAESAFYDIHLSDICASASVGIDWAHSFGKLVAAIKPIFLYREC